MNAAQAPLRKLRIARAFLLQSENVAAAMLYKFARLLQIAGLIIVPFAISGNVAEKLDLKQSLILSAIGTLVFLAGWLLQQAVRRE